MGVSTAGLGTRAADLGYTSELTATAVGHMDNGSGTPGFRAAAGGRHPPTARTQQRAAFPLLLSTLLAPFPPFPPSLPPWSVPPPIPPPHLNPAPTRCAILALRRPPAVKPATSFFIPHATQLTSDRSTHRKGTAIPKISRPVLRPPPMPSPVLNISGRSWMVWMDTSNTNTAAATRPPVSTA